jgi:hypothetical protein
MKIYPVLSILVLLVLSCSTNSLIPATPTIFVPASLPTETLPPPTASPTDTLALTDTPAPSITPTQSALTFTAAPTLSSTDTALTGTIASLTNTVTATAQATATSTSQIPPTPQGPVFQSVTLSGSQLKWGNTCDTNVVSVTVQVTNGYGVTDVLLFVRLQAQSGLVTTLWDKAFEMHTAGLGTFTYDLSAPGIKYYQDFNTAWVQYQLVAYNVAQSEVGRTQVYANNLTLMRCP